MSRAIEKTFHVEHGYYFRRYSDGSVEFGREENKTYTVYFEISQEDWRKINNDMNTRKTYE